MVVVNLILLFPKVLLKSALDLYLNSRNQSKVNFLGRVFEIGGKLWVY